MTGADPARVSVVMTVRNGERHVAAAITSILGQSRPPAEIVVVDDGSTDGTIGVLDDFSDPVRVIRQPARGAASGLNTGVGAATGDVIAFLDSDDLWTTDALALRLDRLDGADSPDGVFGRTRQFVSPEMTAAMAHRLPIDHESVSAPMLGALVVRRDVFALVGSFDESLPSAEGVDSVARARDAGVRLVAIDDDVLHRRLHATNTGRTLPRETTLAALRRVVHAHHRRHDDRRRGNERHDEH